jgi:uncharacterized protein with WD repeat
MASNSMRPPPRVSFILRNKSGTELRLGPVAHYNKNLKTVKRVVEPREGFRSEAKTAYAWSADGARFAVTDGESFAAVYDAATLKPLQRLERKIATVALSPLGTYLLTWEKLNKEAPSDPNLLVWDVATGEQAGGFVERGWSRETWPPVRWSEDEAVASRCATNQVHFYPGRPFACGRADVLRKVHCKGVASCSMGPTTPARDREAGQPAFRVACFVPERRNQAASVAVYAFPAGADAEGAPRTGESLGDPCAQKGFFNAQEARLQWAPSGRAILVRTHTEQGSGKDSYYGKTALHLMQADGTGDCTLPAPAHSAAWSPDPEADEFVTVTGRVPPKIELRDVRGDVVKDFGARPVNAVSFAPHGRFFACCGFTGMQGKMFFFDRAARALLGEGQATSPATWGWAPDSCSFLTACCHPRMKQGNCVEVFSCRGEILYREEHDELYEAGWRPGLPPFTATKLRGLGRGAAPSGGDQAAPTVYPEPPPGPPPKAGRARDRSVRGAVKQVKASRGVYRAPGSSGGLADAMRRARGLEPRGGGGKGASGKGGAGVPGMPPPVPGMPVGGAPARGSGFAQQKKRSRRRKKKPEAAAEAVGSGKLQAAGSDAPAADVPSEMDEKAIAKALKKARKRLKQIDAVKAKAAAGETINDDQRAKLDTEAEVRAEIARLEALQK